MHDDSAVSGDRPQVPPLVHATMIAKALEAAPSLALITCGDDGNIVAATAGATAISGYDRDQLLGTPFAALFDAPLSEERLREVVRTRLRRFDGSIVDVCVYGASEAARHSSPPRSRRSGYHGKEETR